MYGSNENETKKWREIITKILNELNNENDEIENQEETKILQKPHEAILLISQSIEWKKEKKILNNFFNIWYDNILEILEDVMIEFSCDAYENRYSFKSRKKKKISFKKNQIQPFLIFQKKLLPNKKWFKSYSIFFILWVPLKWK